MILVEKKTRSQRSSLSLQNKPKLKQIYFFSRLLEKQILTLVPKERSPFFQSQKSFLRKIVNKCITSQGRRLLQKKNIPRAITVNILVVKRTRTKKRKEKEHERASERDGVSSSSGQIMIFENPLSTRNIRWSRHRRRRRCVWWAARDASGVRRAADDRRV